MRLVIPPDGDNPIQHFRHAAAVVFAIVMWFVGTIVALWLIIGGDVPGRIIGSVLVIVLLFSARRGLSYRNKASS